MKQEHLDIVRTILRKYPSHFMHTAPEQKQSARKFSDLDLCIMEPISIDDLGKIMNDFDESNLPFKVDICNWDSLSDDFKQHIKPDLEPL